MSIIHEALKKVQENMSAPQSPPEEVMETLTISSGDHSSKRPSLLYLLTTGLVILGLVGYLSSIKIKPLLTVKPVGTITPHPSTMNTTPFLPNKDVRNSPPSQTPAFDLQGVMADGNHNIALINGNMYAEGDLVDGTKIIKIDLDTVTVERIGKQEVIPVKK